MSNFIPSLEAFAKGSFATAAGLSTIGFGLLYYGQNFLIYPSAFPPGSRTEVPTPTDFGLPYEDLTLTTPDGFTIRAYLLLQRKELSQHQESHVDYDDDMSDDDFSATRPTVIMFHGNGGNHGHRIPLARVFYTRMRCNVLMPSYRGYGLSEGTPSEKGLCIDAQAALDYVISHPHLSRGPTILYGQSIGGAVAIDLASNNPSKIRALVLENTFTSLRALIPTRPPLLAPLTFLCHQKWDSASKVPRIPRATPVLMLGGARDEVVPREHMRALWGHVVRAREAAAGAGAGVGVGKEAGADADVDKEGTNDVAPEAGTTQPVQIVRGNARYIEFAAGTHNDTCVQPGYWHAVADFVATIASSSASASTSTSTSSPSPSPSSQTNTGVRRAPEEYRVGPHPSSTCSV